MWYDVKFPSNYYNNKFITKNQKKQGILHISILKFNSLTDFNNRKNMSLLEYYFANFRQYLILIKEPFNYPKSFRNFFYVFINKIKKNYPIRCVLKNGSTVIVQNHLQLRKIKFGRGTCFFENDLILIKSPNFPILKIQDWEKNGDIHAVFFLEDYSFLPLKNKTVIDIGANIGDTPLYFISRGAKKVIGIEPSQKNFESAKKNIILNNLSDKIDLILGGCASKGGIVKIDPNVSGLEVSLNEESKSSNQIQLITLKEILENEDKDSEYVLKIDCEGCEYDIILGSPENIIKRFSHIQIEYHFGYLDMKKRLESYGFEVTHTSPRRANRIGTINTLVGFLYAKNKSL